MYFLVFVPKASGGDGVIVFCTIALCLVLIVGAAAAAFPWLVAPATLIYALTQTERLAWVLPVVFATAAVINLVIAKRYESWMPLAPGTLAAVLAVVACLFLVIQEIVRQGRL